MSAKLTFKIDERLFIAKIKGVGTKVIPYVKSDIRDLAKWAFKEVKTRTPEVTSGRTEIKDLWTMTEDKSAAREMFVIKNLYPNQDVLIYIEEGTQPHIITPQKPGGLLHFFIKGDEIFTKLVRHPGTPAYGMVGSVEAELRSKVDWLTKRFFDHVRRLEAMGIT
jgi:hypothetical protein